MLVARTVGAILVLEVGSTELAEKRSAVTMGPTAEKEDETSKLASVLAD